MRKYAFLAVFLLVIAGLALVACGEDSASETSGTVAASTSTSTPETSTPETSTPETSTPETSTPETAKFELHFSETGSAQGITNHGAKLFKEAVEDKTDGNITVVLHL